MCLLQYEIMFYYVLRVIIHGNKVAFGDPFVFMGLLVITIRFVFG